jgi:hypothetical protein
MRIILVSNFDITSLDSSIIENIDFFSFVKLFFPKYEYEDLKDIFDENLKIEGLNIDDTYKLSKLDKIYNNSVKHLNSNFHNLNDFLFLIPQNARLASHEYRNKEKYFYANFSAKNFCNEKNKIKNVESKNM